jgi:hypothetical protein
MPEQEFTLAPDINNLDARFRLGTVTPHNEPIADQR